MKKTIRTIFAGVLVAVSLLGGVGCGKTAPDYSNSTLQFDFYGYSGPTDGTWTEYGVNYYAGEDFRTVERFKEYKDAGMTIYLPQSAGSYSGQVWETSNAKMVMDRAVEAGLGKIILTDSRIQGLSATEGGLIGEGKRFASEDELDATITEYMAPYRTHEGFYGVMLKDEPSYTHFKAYGEVYKSIKRVCPEAFVQGNLLPMIKTLSTERYPSIKNTSGMTSDQVRVARYKLYLEMFLDETGADYIMYDQYPMNDTYIYETYIPCLQAASEVARDRGVKLYMVTQTMNMTQNGNAYQRTIKEADAYWLNNMLVGFGVKQISYFTYWTKQANNHSEFFNDGGSFMTRYGKKTDIYYIMQQIMKEEQKFAPTVLNFDYSTSSIVKKVPMMYSAGHINLALKGNEYKLLTEASVDKECALITELYDDEKDLYMYMFQNVIDPLLKGPKVLQTITADFDDSCTHAAVFVKGERTDVKLEKGGKLTLKHSPGEATYVIPY